MKHTLLTAGLVACVGCGTIMNGKPATLTIPDGALVDGIKPSGPMRLTKDADHHIIFADGRQCTIESKLSLGYFAVDVLAFPIGWVVDAVTGDWSKLNASSCPGVIVN